MMLSEKMQVAENTKFDKRQPVKSTKHDRWFHISTLDKTQSLIFSTDKSFLF